MRSRLRELLGAGDRYLDAGQRSVLSVGNARHEAQVITYGMPDGLLLAELTQTLRTPGKDIGTVGEADPRDRALRKSLNLGGVENALHECSRGTRPGDASRPSPQSPCPGSSPASSP